MIPYTTPILIVIFNRPQKVQTLVDALADVAPQKIYIIADGPREHIPNDIEKCAQTREIISRIPWECEVHTKFLDTNIGCDAAVPMGIDWFFENVEAGIILEDDCIPHPSFFSFCTELLEKYKDNEKVMHISGNNFQDGIIRGDASYYFSLYTHSWGWATWRRAWVKFHPAVSDLPQYLAGQRIQSLPLSEAAKRFWSKNLKNRNYWDSLWLYTVWHENGIAIIPNKNLVSNIGFDGDATHTFSKNSQAFLATENIGKTIHPKTITLSNEADSYIFDEIFYASFLERVYYKIRDIISKYL